jgi:citrate lyase beta subunit
MKLHIHYGLRSPTTYARALSNKSAILVLNKYRRRLDEILIGDESSVPENFKPTVEHIIKLFEQEKLDKKNVCVKIHSEDKAWSDWVIKRFNEIDIVCDKVKYELQE